jgi:hypothetical protein
MGEGEGATFTQSARRTQSLHRVGKRGNVADIAAFEEGAVGRVSGIAVFAGIVALKVPVHGARCG